MHSIPRSGAISKLEGLATWVEDRTNKQATGPWKKQRRLAMQVAAALPRFSPNTMDRRVVEFMLWNAGIEMTAPNTM